MGRIIPRAKSGLTDNSQRKIARLIKRARSFGMILLFPLDPGTESVRYYPRFGTPEGSWSTMSFFSFCHDGMNLLGYLGISCRHLLIVLAHLPLGNLHAAAKSTIVEFMIMEKQFEGNDRTSRPLIDFLFHCNIVALSLLYLLHSFAQSTRYVLVPKFDPSSSLEFSLTFGNDYELRFHFVFVLIVSSFVVFVLCIYV
jgi:hypothetical protein